MSKATVLLIAGLYSALHLFGAANAASTYEETLDCERCA